MAHLFPTRHLPFSESSHTIGGVVNGHSKNVRLTKRLPNLGGLVVLRFSGMSSWSLIIFFFFARLISLRLTIKDINTV